jgi:hypothetical protein
MEADTSRTREERGGFRGVVVVAIFFGTGINW